MCFVCDLRCVLIVISALCFDYGVCFVCDILCVLIVITDVWDVCFACACLFVVVLRPSNI